MKGFPIYLGGAGASAARDCAHTSCWRNCIASRLMRATRGGTGDLHRAKRWCGRASAFARRAGGKRFLSAQGEHYDLDEVFETLNPAILSRIDMSPSADVERGDGAAAAGALRSGAQHHHGEPVFIAGLAGYWRSISMYPADETLCTEASGKQKNGRRCVHSSAFQAEEKLFPDLEWVKAYLKTI